MSVRNRLKGGEGRREVPSSKRAVERFPVLLGCVTGFTGCAVALAWADDSPASTVCAEASAATCVVGDTVLYAPVFFSQYNPVTALDMVQRVPGFSIDSGDNVRGFGGAAGNVLIDGQRPSTKSTDIFQTLSRISADSVERIELIRGGTGGLDVGGKAVVVNVVLKADASAKPTAPWSFDLIKRRPNGWLRPQGEISYSSSIGRTKFTLGADAFGFGTRFGGDEQITRFFGDDEMRHRDGVYKEQGGGVNFKMERQLANDDTARFNFESRIDRSNEEKTEIRHLAAGGPDIALFAFPFKDFSFEAGGDFEHGFTENFDIKLIALHRLEFQKFDSEFELLPAIGDSDRSIFSSDQTIGETIGRAEFGWKGWSKHAFQFGGEFARNFIDSKAELLVDDGIGGLTPVDIAGANTRVTELRGETFINDSWGLASKLTLDLGFALELSRIAQSGDNANSRFFKYPKPSATLTYTPTDKTQWRFSGVRKVNQLSFGQFVSSVNFDDEDVDFGNPELRPQRTWEFEAAYERRFGKIGVVELMGFFDYIQDVEDLLPIGGIVEVPGNIGDGRIYGGTIKVTAPFDWLGLKNSRVESSVTQRDSSVTDPVTGFDREISFTPNRTYEAEFRQDFPAKKLSWGFDVRGRSEQLSFGLDELSRFTLTPEYNVYVETTVIKGVKARFAIRDITNVNDTRDRTVFQNSRALNVPLFREVRGVRNGGAFRLTLSGAL